jgi:predicted RNA-binding protein YlqC (UPF0109 family)
MFKEFVEYVIKHLVDDKNAVEVTQRQAESKHIVEIRVAPQDLGKVIGKGGATIRSVRAIVALIGSQRGYDVQVEVAK